ELFLFKDVYESLQTRVREHLRTTPRLNVATMKELFGVSRKYAIPFLEHLDDIRVTRRDGDDRVPYA
ncbi:MAG: SelB C-terminal domain-containing protein, partial [Candidatus Methylomirabilota bacterium]